MNIMAAHHVMGMWVVVAVVAMVAVVAVVVGAVNGDIIE